MSISLKTHLLAFRLLAFHISIVILLADLTGAILPYYDLIDLLH